jgi:hypothetical protein
MIKLFFAGALASACATTSGGTTSYAECAAARACTVRGTMSARLAEGAWMGQLDLGSGTCVSVALPSRIIAELRRDGPRTMTVTGEVYGDPFESDSEIRLEIQGRKIGLGLCGDFFLFVPDGGRIL